MSVFVVLVMQQAERMPLHLWPVQLYILPHNLINDKIFGKKKQLDIKMYVFIFSTTVI